VFGSGFINANPGSTANFTGWEIGDFGDAAELRAQVDSTAWSLSTVFGAGWATGGERNGTPGNGIVNFSGWKIGRFANGAKLSASANNHSSVFGAGWTSDGGINFNDWTIGGFGGEARLCATAYCSTLFGPARADQGGPFHHWTIGHFEGGAALTAVAVSSDGANPSFASVFGAAYNDRSFAATVQDWTVEFRGNATLTTAGYNAVSSDPNAENYDTEKGDWVRLGTLGGDRNDSLRFFFNSGAGAVVNIAALKLSEAVTTVDSGSATRQATMKLSADQGQNNAENYARAVALGPNFQLNIGRSRMVTSAASKVAGKTLETDYSIANGGQPHGDGGTMNIFGAISRARMGDSTAGSILRIDSGWTVNAYGPVEDLASIRVNNGTFNTYERIKNVTLSSGETTAYGISDGIGTITINGGNLRIAGATDTHFEEHFSQLENDTVYIDPAGVEYLGAGTKTTKNTVEIRDNGGHAGHDYPWKGHIGGGKLIMNAGDTMVFHVDTSRTDQSINSMAPGDAGSDGMFELANGHVAIDADVSGGLVFKGGKIRLVNDDPNNRTVLPSHTDLWIIRTAGLDGIEFDADFYGDGGDPSEEGQIPGVEKFTLPTEIVCCECDDCDDCARLEGPLQVYLFRNSGISILGAGDDGRFFGGDASGGVYISNDSDVPVVAIPVADAYRQVNSELAGIAAETSSLLRLSVANKLANPRGSAGGPFAAFLGGRLRQDVINGFGYRFNSKGVSLGIDRLYQLADPRHSLRLGAIVGYLTGTVHFSGTASGRGKIAEQKLCSGALFAAYEAIGKNDLKANINIFAGLQHAKNELCRVNTKGYSIFGKMNENGQFVAVEALRILHRTHGGVQIGPWALVSYDRVHQEGYGERGNAPKNAGTQTLTAITHNFLDATLGLDVEKEWQHLGNQLDIAHVFLRCGWQHRVLRDRSAASVKFNSEALKNGSYAPTFGYPGRNSLAIAAGLRASFNDRWDGFISLRSTLSKSSKTFALSLALGYNF
jgi:hypothetical protein